MNKQSFDVYLKDSSALTAEATGPDAWQVTRYFESGKRQQWGIIMGDRDTAMLKLEKLGRIFDKE